MGEGDGGRYGPDEADRRAHGRRLRVRGRGEVGPKEEAVSLRQAQAGGPRGPKDRGGRAQQADTRARVVPRVAPRAPRSVRAARRRGRRVGGRRGAQARAAPQLEAGAHGGLLHGLRGVRPALEAAQVLRHARDARRRADRPPATLGAVRVDWRAGARRVLLGPRRAARAGRSAPLRHDVDVVVPWGPRPGQVGPRRGRRSAAAGRPGDARRRGGWGAAVLPQGGGHHGGRACGGGR